ncbi:flagellin, partial [Thioalkalivibrio sp. ALE21]|uniref:flagellin n=1 Tax=Thioalkalivibrio sp. ALE21 TaxID=1158175 RepID=UPI000D81B927
GQNILDGSVEDLFFQVGANQGQMTAVNGVDSRTTQLGMQEAVGETLDADTLADLDLSDQADIVIDVGDEDDAVTVDLGDDVDTLDDVVREINSAIAEVAAGDDDAAEAVSDANLEASVRVDNDGNQGIAITGAFDSEFSVDQDGGDLFADADSEEVNLTDIDVTTRDSATEAIGALDGALDQVNSLRSELGAVQTRFESTISNLEIGSENLSDARSRIMDADFAAETAELTRAEVLQQAGTSVLSQANAVPQNVLGLLQ